MEKYCEVCGKNVAAEIITKKESYAVCGESVEVNAEILVCAECGAELFCEALDSATLNRAYDEYRRRHKLMFPEEIKRLRECYSLSQRSFAKLLNWGDKTVHRYENGAIQDKAHNSLLLFLREPQNMRRYLTENEIQLEPNQMCKLLQNVEKLEEGTADQRTEKLVTILFNKPPSIDNGFKAFDYEKLCAMVLFFAHQSQELLKVKLMKLLNYADMIYFKENGVSISGTEYIHYPYGPVPEHYDFLMGMMENDQVAHIEISFENGYEKHQVIADCNMPEAVLTAEELSVLRRVYERFVGFSSAEISEYSHREKGYRLTELGELIPYSYAKDMQL